MKRSLHPADAPPTASRLRLTQLVRATVLAGLTMAATASARADAIVDFNGLPPVELTHATGVVNHGFQFALYSSAADAQPIDAAGAIIDGTNALDSCGQLQCPSSSGSYAAVIADSYVELTSANGGAFGIKSFDASFLGSNLYTYPAVPSQLIIVGIRADNTTLSQQFDLFGPTAGRFNFSHYLTDSAFYDTQFVALQMGATFCPTSDRASCSLFETGLGQFALDNIELTSLAAPVPEPSAWLMMGAGLMGVAAAVRRQRRQA